MNLELPVSFDPSELVDAALVSCDVFDTLLMRHVSSPALVFDIVGREAAARGLVDSGLAPPLFRQVRQDAERRARAAAPSSETDLASIYSYVGLGNAAALAALELEVEASLIYANPLMLSVLEELARQGRPAVLLSDMYLGTEQIRGLLRGAGIGDELYRALFVSSEHGCSKRNGGLFRKLLRDNPAIQPSHIMHIGDDPIGDVAMARSAGLRAVHYAPSPSLAHLHDRERAICGMAAPVAVPRRLLVSLAGRKDPLEHAAWLEFGSLVLGPAVAEYCRWVVEDCHRRGIDLIAPLMREAAVFAPLMRDWIRHRGYAIRIVPLHVSRQALAPLEFAELDHTVARCILTAKPHMAWDRLLEQAGGLIPEDFAFLAGHTLEMLAGKILPSGFSALEAVLRLFDDPVLRRAATLRAAEQRSLILEHLAERIGTSGRVSLMDLGARGSTPAALAKVVPDGRTRFHIHLCYAVADVGALLADGLHVCVYAGGSERAMSMGRILYRSPQILERALTGLFGTTVGYKRDAGGRCVPEIAPVSATAGEAERLALLQEGIRRYAALLVATSPPSGDPRLCPGEEALLPLTAALTIPTAWEADALGDLTYDQNDGVDGVRRICDADTLDGVHAVAAMKEGPTMGLALGLRPSRVPWPQGALTRLDPGIFRRPADMLAIDAGHAPICRAMVARLRTEGSTRVVVLAVGGDGGMGPDFIRTARESGVEPAAYADLMEHLVSSSLFHGVPVVEMSNLASLSPLPLVLVTLGYAERLADLVQRQFAAVGRIPHIIALCRPDLEVRSG